MRFLFMFPYCRLYLKLDMVVFSWKLHFVSRLGTVVALRRSGGGSLHGGPDLGASCRCSRYIQFSAYKCSL
jgi:hypothetical protein